MNEEEKLLDAPSEQEALELFHELKCTDGLPVAIPTQERVDNFVLASGQDADMILGKLGPAISVATIQKAAAAAEKADCKSGSMP